MTQISKDAPIAEHRKNSRKGGKQLLITYEVFSNKGRRDINEDYAGAFEKNGRYCFVLCDGLGGHGMGDAASQCVVETFKTQFNEYTAELKDFLPETFEMAQDFLLGEQIARNAKTKMKTTAVAMLTDGVNIYIGHIGDSRCYAFGKKKVKFRTLDHSVPQMLVISHEIKESEIRNHPDRSLVLKAMGTKWEDGPEYEIMKEKKLRGLRAFLLCSDGFWELIEEKQMCELLKSSSTVKEWVDGMVEIIWKNGEGKNMDNFSAVAVWNTKE